jgi:hypothetical protein
MLRAIGTQRSQKGNRIFSRKDAKTLRRKGDGPRPVIPSDRLCEKSVIVLRLDSARTVNEYDFNYLSVRPELSRRAPIEFSHSLANARDLRKISPCGRLCEKSVIVLRLGSARTVNECDFNYLSVRPERRRRAPIEFSHSLSVEMTSIPNLACFAPWRESIPLFEYFSSGA